MQTLRSVIKFGGELLLFGQTFVNGLLMGGVYALIAVGLTMIFGVMNIVNFAQGEFMMLGMYCTWAFAQCFHSNNPYLLIIPVMAATFLIGMLLYRLFVHPVIGQGDTAYILLTVGLSYFLQNIAQVIWGADPRSIDTPLKSASISLGLLSIIVPRLIAFLLAVLFMLLFGLFLSKTDMGRAMRATSENATVAQILGVNTRVMFLVAFGLGTALSAVAGCIISPMYSIYPRVGQVFATTIFACVIIGGLGDIKGAFVGGILIGLVEAFASSYLALNLAPTCVFAVMLLFMLLKPDGLFGKGARVG